MTESITVSAPENTFPDTQITQSRAQQQKKLAIADILQGFKSWRIWIMIAYQDVKLRYRRSVLGPFWITISMAITAYSMGFLYSKLFHTDIQSYFPFLVAGMLTWALLSSQISDLTEGYTTSEGLIKQLKLPYSLYIHRTTTRNFIIFFHNILVIVPILILYHQVAKVNLHTLLILPGLLAIYLNSITFGTILAIIGARYRDIAQIIKSLIQVAFFLTPVMWNPNILSPQNQFIVKLNPFYAFIELVRAPLLGQVPELGTVLIALGVTLIGFLVSFVMFTKYRARIVYWL